MAVELLEEVLRQPIEGPIYLRAERVADEAAQLEVSEYRQMGDQKLEELIGPSAASAGQ